MSSDTPTDVLIGQLPYMAPDLRLPALITHARDIAGQLSALRAERDEAKAEAHRVWNVGQQEISNLNDELRILEQRCATLTEERDAALKRANEAYPYPEAAPWTVEELAEQYDERNKLLDRYREENARLAQRVAMAEQNERRYLWLRERDVTFETDDGNQFVSYIPELEHDGSNLDAAIDAALPPQGGQHG